VLSSAEQRAVRSRDSAAVARVADVYAAIPSMTGKFELEYEGRCAAPTTLPGADSRGSRKDLHKIFQGRELSGGRAVV